MDTFNKGNAITSILIILAITTTSAVPIMANANNAARSALIAIRRLSGELLPQLTFYVNACHVLDDMAAINVLQDENQTNDSTVSAIIHVGKHVKEAICMKAISDGDIIADDGDCSCSDSKLDLFCAQLKLWHDADTAQKLLDGPNDQYCEWRRNTIDMDPNITEDEKNDIRTKLFCDS